MVTAFAPGKCILFGEHAVVYGHPAVAVSIDSGIEITVEECERWEINNQNNTNGFDKTICIMLIVYLQPFTFFNSDFNIKIY